MKNEESKKLVGANKFGNIMNIVLEQPLVNETTIKIIEKGRNTKTLKLAAGTSDFCVNATDDILIKAYEGQKKIGNIVKMIDDTSERFILLSITDIYALEKTTHSIIGKLKVEYNTQKCTKLLKFNIEAKKVECGVFKIIDPYTGEFKYNALNVGEDKIFYSFNDEYGLKKYGLIIIVVVPEGCISTYRNEESLY